MSLSPELLQKRVEARRAERERYDAIEKDRTERQRLYDTAFDSTPMQFWCDTCEADFETIGHKTCRTRLDLNTGRSTVIHPIQAYYFGYCPAKHRAIRRITDKEGDPYYRKSLMLRRQRIDMADAMLQPHDPRFRIVYPQAWKRMEEERELRDAAMRGEI